MEYLEFSARLKQLRGAKGISQRELAEQIHVSRSAVAKWENGLGLPGEDSAQLLAEYFGISREELFPKRQEEAKLVEKNVTISRQRTAIWALSAVLGAVLLSVAALLYRPFLHYLPPFGLGALITALGVFNLRGNIASIRWYNRRKVKEEDQKPYCRLMGLGTIFCGVGLMLFGALQSVFQAPWMEYLLLCCVLAGVALMCYSQFRYNRGLF